MEEQSRDVEEEEGKDNPSMRELSQEIDAHVVVLDEENPTTIAPTQAQGAPQSTPASVTLSATVASTTASIESRDPTS